MKLQCGVYSEGTVFSVEIEGDAEVEALQKAIFDKKRYKERYPFDASDLTLYLARNADVPRYFDVVVGTENQGHWLKDDENVKIFLQSGVSKEYREMRPSWKLKNDYLKNFDLGEKNIHVLVELPRYFIPSTSKHLKYKRMSVEASNRKFLDLIALRLRSIYYFPQRYRQNPTFGDILEARRTFSWRYIGPKTSKKPRLDNVFTLGQWMELEQLNQDTTMRIHDARLPTTSDGRKFVLVLEHAKFTERRVKMLEDIAKAAHVVTEVNELIIKGDGYISSSSGSSNATPPNSGGS